MPVSLSLSSVSLGSCENFWKPENCSLVTFKVQQLSFLSSFTKIISLVFPSTNKNSCWHACFSWHLRVSPCVNVLTYMVPPCSVFLPNVSLLPHNSVPVITNRAAHWWGPCLWMYFYDPLLTFFWMLTLMDGYPLMSALWWRIFHPFGVKGGDLTSDCALTLQMSSATLASVFKFGHTFWTTRSYPDKSRNTFPCKHYQPKALFNVLAYSF